MVTHTIRGFNEVFSEKGENPKANSLFSSNQNIDQEKEPIVHIGFTGHRPKKLGGYNIDTPQYKKLQSDLENCIENALKKYNVVVGHSGLALGGDTIWSKAILSMRTKNPDRIEFHAEIPMLEQAEQWFKKSDTDFWEYQVEQADHQTVYGSLENKSPQERKYLSSKLLNERNEGMLDHSDVLLALWNGSSGGTSNAVAYGRKNKMNIFTVHPANYFA